LRSVEEGRSVIPLNNKGLDKLHIVIFGTARKNAAYRL